jgi:hypothetical protein
MYSVWFPLLAVIAVGEMLLTEGTCAAAVTVTDCVPEEQVLEFASEADSQIRTLIVSATVPGSIGIAISEDVIVGVLLLLFQL